VHDRSGRKALLIGGAILGGIWLFKEAYWDGFTAGLIASGKATAVTPVHYAGGGFPWGLLIIGGIIYLLWRKGMFGGPGRNGGYGPGRGIQRYGGGYGPGYEPGPAPDAPGAGQPQGQGQNWGPEFHGPRAWFEEWHRQAHEAERAQRPAPPAPPAPPAQTQAYGNANPQGGMSAAPPPPAPSPEYWTSMARAASAANDAGNAGAPVAPPAAESPRQDEQPDGPRGATGPALERW
jgi:hypothetical protein